jgi:hypothetical protein
LIFDETDLAADLRRVHRAAILCGIAAATRLMPALDSKVWAVSPGWPRTLVT